MRKVHDGDRRKTFKTAQARAMRLSPSKAELYMWHALRGRRFAGLKFRRQQPVGPYIADFYCASAKLIVEMDGGQHALPENQERDAQRTRWLTEHGFHVIRMWNADFLREPGELLDYLGREMDRLGITPPRNLQSQISTLPQGEGED